MILILSQEYSETSTDDVIEWISALGGEFLRINGESITDVHKKLNITLGVENGYESNFIDFDKVNVVWFRRWHHLDFFNLDQIENKDGYHKIRKFLSSETIKLSSYIFNFLEKKTWVSRPEDGNISKLTTLKLANEVGLEIPKTLITNSKEELYMFFRKCKEVITKPISDVSIIKDDNYSYTLYTEQVNSKDFDKMPNNFFPSLFQEKLEKEYEIRIFYLDGDIYSMAIFSQNDKQTSVDFRKYNNEIPNRNVPYILPTKIKSQIKALMKKLKLVTGSIDFVKTLNGDYVFLEVNPVGQFGMVSDPCNYFLEKKIAEYLIKIDKNER